LNKKLTIHDIARELKISAATVSIVMNGRADEMRISQKLQEKVRAYLHESGFQPNMIAQSLRTGKTFTIGMLVEDISDPFFSSIARFIEMKAYKLGYKLFFSSTENDTDRAKSLIQIFRDRQVDGYIIAPAPGIEGDIQALLDDKCSVVLFDRYFPQLKTHNVIVDNLRGACDVVRHLIENGFCHIGFVTLESAQTQMADRLDGYKKAVEEKGMEAFIEMIPYNLDEYSIKAKVTAFIAANTQLDAILFATNYLAVAGIKAIHTLGFSIPADIAVAGFDDNTNFELFSPSITSVAQPVQDISEHLIGRLISLMAGNTGRQMAPHTSVLPVEIIVRESSLNHKQKKVNAEKINTTIQSII
jgi:LacI family transcriptional regulator